jgi:O-antigen ligase
MVITKNFKKAFLILTYLLGCFPILTFGMRSVITIVWSVLGVFLFLKVKGEYKLKKDIWIFVLPFLIMLLSLSYSSNIEYGLSTLVKMISFIIYPIILYLNRDFFPKKQILKIFYFFSFSLLILIIYQATVILLNYNFITGNITIQEIKSNGFKYLSEITLDKVDQIKTRRFRNFIIKISNTHTTYQGLWICFGVFFLSLELKKHKRKLFLFLNALSISILLIWFYMVSARITFLAFGVSIVSFVFVFSGFSTTVKILISLLFSSFFITFLFFNNPVSIRVKEYYKTGFSLLDKKTKTTKFNSSNVRNGIFYCDFKLIQSSPLLGIGIGDIQDSLNSCYKEDLSSEIYKWHTYNSHNQYIYFWISTGILGLMSIVFLILKTFAFSLKEKNKLLFLITCLIAITFFTENLLERSDGLIFYSFFTGLLFFNKLKE